MTAFVFTVGFITLVAGGTYLIYKLLVAIKLIVVGKVWKTLSKPAPDQIVSFLKLVKNEKLVYSAKPFSYLKYADSNDTDNKTIQPVSKPVKANLDGLGHKEVVS